MTVLQPLPLVLALSLVYPFAGAHAQTGDSNAENAATAATADNHPMMRFMRFPLLPWYGYLSLSVTIFGVINTSNSVLSLVRPVVRNR